jgi:hypothetical protein
MAKSQELLGVDFEPDDLSGNGDYERIYLAEVEQSETKKPPMPGRLRPPDTMRTRLEQNIPVAFIATVMLYR